MINNKGFTMVEVIVVVAVLAVVLTIATPDMSRLFAKQAEMTESIRLQDIYKSLDIYAKKNKSLPSAATWVQDLSEYSELSENQIEKDTWGTNRRYSMFKGTASYLGGTYDIYYAVVASDGLDRSNNGEILPVNASEFAQFDYRTSTTGNANDNMAVKYTDQSYKIELLEETLRRMEKLSLALSKYSRVMQIQGISSNPDDSDSFIYFPEDKRAGDPGNSKYYTNVGEIDGNQNEATALATLLGLPAYYGENALTDSTMWYISNPGPDGANICNGARSTAPFYPPVIMISDTGNPC
jgi:prepilin-type N-terminal cleavage/methylation domain-containing protein